MPRNLIRGALRKYMCLKMAAVETNRAKIVARLHRQGWTERHGREHDVFTHSAKPGRIIVPRHRTLSPGVARAIAKHAEWGKGSQ